MALLRAVPVLTDFVTSARKLTKEAVDWLQLIVNVINRVQVGSGSPAGVVVADIGTLWLRTDGGAGTTLYVKEGNSGTSAGWRAV